MHAGADTTTTRTRYAADNLGRVIHLIRDTTAYDLLNRVRYTARGARTITSFYNALHLDSVSVNGQVTSYVANALGWVTSETDPVKVELDLNGLIPPEERGGFSLRLILHGRKVCGARRPQCDDCSLADICPSAGRL